MKYILVLMLGFVVHKGLEELYDYSFEIAYNNDVCWATYQDRTRSNPLQDRFDCTYREMGLVYKLSYILARPHWADPYREWGY